ncbi:hypothetical protein [Stratiformator vulcanicus]|uniref:hypothetical protein n=1 Tax=Stratiformator vulcanicus TaxID=2527980 RepID=UPI0011A15804|nr:hypothetical protein [Stratiformator vulcanicus]
MELIEPVVLFAQENRLASALGRAIGGTICSALIGSLITAVIFRAACSLFNRLASADAVPEPDFGKAYGIMFASTIVNNLMGFTVGLLVGMTFGPDSPLITVATAISIPVAFLVLSGFISAMLPTSFPKSMGLAGLTTVIGLLVLAVVVGVLVAVMFATGVGAFGR